VAYVTLSIEGVVGDARRELVDGAVRGQGGSATWRVSELAGRTYALLDLPSLQGAAAIREASGGVAYETPIIAVAVFPTSPEALPYVREALDGPGRPAGVLACRPCDGGAIVEWDPGATGPELIFALIDLELRRFASGRRTELLTPLPDSLLAKIAAEGLRAPQIEPERVLERRIDDL